MIDRFLYWGDHGNQKSGEIKGSCQLPPGLMSCGIFIYLKKTFDTVDHKILLRKLDHHGFRGITNIWFSSYLQGRTQTTQIGPHISEWLNSTCGVP